MNLEYVYQNSYRGVPLSNSLSTFYQEYEMDQVCKELWEDFPVDKKTNPIYKYSEHNKIPNLSMADRDYLFSTFGKRLYLYFKYS
jgi:hypothetical protein